MLKFFSISWSIFFFHCFPYLIMFFSFSSMFLFPFSLSCHLHILLGPRGLGLKGRALSRSVTHMSHMTLHMTKSGLHTDLYFVYLLLLCDHIITLKCI